MSTKKNNLLIYYGAGGAAKKYSERFGWPDYFIDSDNKKWGKFINSIEIKPPDYLKTISIKKIVMTTGYVNEVIPIIKSKGISDEHIFIPPKSHLGNQPFILEKTRKELDQKIKSNDDFTFKEAIEIGERLDQTARGLKRAKEFRAHAALAIPMVVIEPEEPEVKRLTIFFQTTKKPASSASNTNSTF